MVVVGDPWCVTMVRSIACMSVLLLRDLDLLAEIANKCVHVYVFYDFLNVTIALRSEDHVFLSPSLA